MGTPPTLQDLREELLKQDEPEAKEIALAIELFTDGSLNTFAKAYQCGHPQPTYLLFQHEYSANFLFTLWKRVRKYGAYCTGITSECGHSLQSHTARNNACKTASLSSCSIKRSTDRIETLPSS